MELHTVPGYVPARSTGMWARSGGTCVVCGDRFPKCRMLMRLLDKDRDGKVAGPKVCKFCSPHISDEVLYRYTMDMSDWQERWFLPLDSNTQVFNGVVASV